MFQDESGVKLALTTLALSWFPVLYFFTFLFYTDQGAIFMVLIMYLFFLNGNNLTASALGAAAIMFRQTNIIWVVYVAGLVVRKQLMLWMMKINEKKDVKLDSLSDWDFLKLTVITLKECYFNNHKLFINLVKEIVRQVYGYILVGLGFAAFVLVNGGIVVGDRSQHVASLNFPQLFYFLSLTNVFAFFHLTSPYKIKSFLKFCWKHPLIVVLFCSSAFLMVHYFTYEHIYLLSDNRHYPFYIWRKLYMRHKYIKYALIPAYLYCTWAFLASLEHRDVFWKIVYFICLVLSLVPQQLLEFRYFIIPYVIYRLNLRYGSYVAIFHEILLYVFVNAATVYLFGEHPFVWQDQKELMRFMW